MKLLADEKVIMSSDEDIVVLTNYRVCYNEVVGGASKYIGITLDAVASCAFVTKSRPLILALAIIAVLGGFLIGQKDSVVLGFVLGAILAVVYFITRRAVLQISSNGGEHIVVPAKGLGRTKILDFLRTVEEAKLRYLGKMSKVE